ncbi:hypothetical protein [uncultured Campylobacter sp.]|uniref:hypothetical protein n=1 Tax=uncultured Campylobacter sp. TaxID=218934 RepID=UPI0026240BC7|nr:hypothetical protein [uncultured Campylobacter sp.]
MYKKISDKILKFKELGSNLGAEFCLKFYLSSHTKRERNFGVKFKNFEIKFELFERKF